MPAKRVIDFSSVKAACRRCGLRQLCLPQGLDERDIDRLDELVHRPNPLQRGEYLFRQGDSFRALYAIRAGSFKTYCLGEDGSQKILGFHLPGELLGLAGLGSGRYRASASALDTAAVCELPFDRLRGLAEQLPSLNRQLYQILSRRISRDQETLLLLGDKSAQERLGTFLLNLAQRFEQRGFSAQEFNLSMSRQDIANYLGLTLETVSRTFTHFQKEGLLSVDRQHIGIRDRTRLAAAAGACASPSSSLAH